MYIPILPSSFFRSHTKEAQKTEIVIEEPVFYDNPENLSQSEIDIKLINLRSYIGPNSKKRYETLESYSTSNISKEEWIEKYTTKF